VAAPNPAWLASCWPAPNVKNLIFDLFKSF
jgi:hypothetical protein